MLTKTYIIMLASYAILKVTAKVWSSIFQTAFCISVNTMCQSVKYYKKLLNIYEFSIYLVLPNEKNGSIIRH